MNLPELFRRYLKTQKVSQVTIKNYVVDINNFFGWLTTKTGIHHRVAGKGILKLLTQETIEEYKTDLLFQNTPLSTINRRLSALRKFSQFVVNQGWLARNETPKVENLQPKVLQSAKPSPKKKILIKFQKHLEQEKISRITVKNYLSDLRDFLTWLEVN